MKIIEMKIKVNMKDFETAKKVNNIIEEALKENSMELQNSGYGIDYKEVK